jgi:hypothetical protein
MMRRLPVALAVISAGVAGADEGMGGTLAGPGFMVYYSYFVKDLFHIHTFVYVSGSRLRHNRTDPATY